MMKIQYSTVLKEEVNITILSLNNTPLIDPLLVLPTVSARWPRRRCSQLILTAADQHTGDYLAARPAALLIIGISFVLMVRWSGIICEALHNINQWPRRTSKFHQKQINKHSGTVQCTIRICIPLFYIQIYLHKHCIALLLCDFQKKRRQYFYFLDQWLYLKAFFFLMNKKMSETS